MDLCFRGKIKIILLYCHPKYFGNKMVKKYMYGDIIWSALNKRILILSNAYYGFKMGELWNSGGIGYLYRNWLPLILTETYFCYIWFFVINVIAMENIFWLWEILNKQVQNIEFGRAETFRLGKKHIFK